MIRGVNDSKYRMLHQWVEKQLGKPQHCVECGTSEKRRYHWANISQEYRRDLSDWRRLCVPCHMREKNPGHCVRGHEMTEENTYTYPKGAKECRTCKRIFRSEYAKRRRKREKETV